MTGLFLVPIITPIVAIIALACWMGMVFWADAHPGGRRTAQRLDLNSPVKALPLVGGLDGAELEPPHQERKAA